MGGLFSSSPSKEEKWRIRQAEQQRQYQEARGQRYYEEQRQTYYRQSLYEEQVRQAARRKLQEQQSRNILLESKRKEYERRNTKKVVIQPYKLNIESVFTLPSFIQLSPSSTEFMEVKRKISNKKNFVIDNLERINNPYLKASYELKKQQMQADYTTYQPVREKLLFHGTKKNVVNKICTYNFDWRCVQAHKFGAGISFSPNSTYASNYADSSYDKVMLLCWVSIKNICPGNKDMVIPQYPFDTSVKSNKVVDMDEIVTVKYEDNDFYPIYKIYYHLKYPNRKVNNRINDF